MPHRLWARAARQTRALYCFGASKRVCGGVEVPPAESCGRALSRQGWGPACSRAVSGVVAAGIVPAGTQYREKSHENRLCDPSRACDSRGLLRGANGGRSVTPGGPKRTSHLTRGARLEPAARPGMAQASAALFRETVRTARTRRKPRTLPRPCAGAMQRELGPLRQKLQSHARRVQACGMRHKLQQRTL